MGLRVSRIRDSLAARTERRLLLLGLDHSGKTAVWNHYKGARGGSDGAGRGAEVGGGEGTTTTATFAVHTFRHGPLTMSLWDVGGTDKLRPYWRHYYTGTQGVLFVVDAADPARVDMSAAELAAVAVDEQLAGVPIVVLANKCDVAGAMSEEELTRVMHLESVLRDHEWTIIRTSAPGGVGLEEVMRWLAGHTKPI